VGHGYGSEHGAARQPDEAVAGAQAGEGIAVRSRNLKPGFFKNEQLAEMPVEARLLFAGLWCMADREGRLEDRPKRVKIELFPGDSFDVDALLTSLHNHGLIERYEAHGIRCIQVLNFLKHQHPHQKEPPSTLPESGASTGQVPDATPSSPVLAPDKSRTRTGAARLIPSSLIPESPSLIPESRKPDSGASTVVHESSDQIQAEYPKTTHRCDWGSALHECAQLVDSGESTWDELLEAVSRYARYVAAGGVSGPQFVLTPQKFFARTKPDSPAPWSTPWEPPASKAETRMASNVAVLEQFVSGGAA
jgi:hypothetical protein